MNLLYIRRTNFTYYKIPKIIYFLFDCSMVIPGTIILVAQTFKINFFSMMANLNTPRMMELTF